jgi:hypothetical protein
MPIPSALVTRFFQLLMNRQFTEAERELERLKQRMQKTEWNRGYFRALYGMFLTRKANGDANAFFSKMDFDDKATMNTYRREFLEHVRNKLHGDFDRGYFSAWADCMRVLSKIIVLNNSNANGPVVDAETSRDVTSDKHQATIENFLKESSD